MTAIPAVPPTQLLVLAKAPVPGRVKTRLVPPCTPEQAARVAGAALHDTLDAVRGTPASRRLLVLDADPGVRPRWAGGGVRPGAPRAAPVRGLPLHGVEVVAQRGTGLGPRIAAAFADTARPGCASLLVGMDTPQLTPALLEAAVARLADADAVIGPADDGGWWVLALRDPADAVALAEVPMSTPDTRAATVAALAARGLQLATAPGLRDVDTPADARAVAALAPRTRFAAAWSTVDHGRAA